jgi:hypothetical protein
MAKAIFVRKDAVLEEVAKFVLSKTCVLDNLFEQPPWKRL